MNKFNTLLRVGYTLGLYLILSHSAYAQSVLPQGSVLNFVKTTVNQQSKVGFAVTNPTANFADVTFTFYGLDGNPVSSGLVNPVRQRVAPKGQVSMLASDLFAASAVDGWVQATSPTPGLIGSYLMGDFTNTLEGAAPGTPLSSQLIPLIRQDSANDSQIVVLNPSAGNSNVILVLYGSAGQLLGQTGFSLSAHAEAVVRPASVVPNLPADNISAFISATVPVVATSIITRNNALLFAPAQSVDALSAAAVRIVPHYLSGNGFDPVLVVANPNSSPVTVKVTLFNENGGSVDPLSSAPPQATFTIPANGSIAKTTTDILGRTFSIPLTINGWLRIDSANLILDGFLVLDGGTAVTALPLEKTGQSTMLYSSVFENPSTSTVFAFVNGTAAAANADLFLVQTDGTTVAQYTISVPALSKTSKSAHDLFPDVANQAGSYIFVRASAPLYSTAVIIAPGAFLADVPFGPVPASYGPDTPGTTPRIHVDSGTDVQSGDTVRVTVSAGTTDDAVFTINSQVLPANQVTAIAGIFLVNLPALETGYVNLRVHANGADSPPVALHVVPPDNSPTQNISGTALYQKIDVTDNGLDLNHPVMFPIRNARVEVLSSITQALVSVSETDDRGRFTVAVPFDPNLTIRILSKIRSFNLRVADNTNVNGLYAISASLDGTSNPGSLFFVDTTRLSGAFNILEMVQRANDTIKMADPNLQPLPVTIFWSTRNTNRLGNPAQGFIGTSEFNISNNTAYILGDRNTDSDEFDDAVIAHEYAHMLAAKYSRDDSPGGAHGLGDMLDPRVAWSEGWANFFSSVVRNDPIWRDSMGPNGTQLLRYDLGDSTAAGDPRPGYWSEASVDTLLWGLYDGIDADNVQYSFSSIWASFRDLSSDRFVYLPYFLDHFISRVSSSTGDVVQLAQSRSINYQPGGLPSVTNPFPTWLAIGTTAGPASVDSFTAKRTNLITSSHFYTFTTTGGATTIRMDIVGLGPGNNPNANDLDIFLYNSNGRLIDKSDTGGNGQTERMADRLGAGTYIVEVRSYYTNGETGTLVFNSGDYRLSLSSQ